MQYLIVTAMMLVSFLFSPDDNKFIDHHWVKPNVTYLSGMAVVPAVRDIYEPNFGYLTHGKVSITLVSDYCVQDWTYDVYDSYKMVVVTYYTVDCTNPGTFSEVAEFYLDTNITGVYTVSMEIIGPNLELLASDGSSFYYGMIPRLFVPLLDTE